MAEAYCLKCKKKCNIQNEVIKKNKKGVNYISGNCNDCGCKINKFIKKNNQYNSS